MKKAAAVSSEPAGRYATPGETSKARRVGVSGSRFAGWQRVAASLPLYKVPEGPERGALLKQIAELLELQKAVAKVRRRKSKPAKPPKTALGHYTPDKRRWRKGQPPPGVVYGKNFCWDPESSGLCPLCHKPMPHRDFAARKAHNYQLARQRGWRKRAQRMFRGVDPVFDKIRDAANQRQVARKMARRAEVFTEEAPHAATVLGANQVLSIVRAYKGRQGTGHQFRRWVQIHYGGKPARSHSEVQKEYWTRRRAAGMLSATEAPV